MLKNFQALIEAVQHNCHISDAKYAGNYTLCIYLLKMREYYRWEKQLRFSDNLPQQAIGAWLTQREALWDDIEQNTFSAIPVNGERIEPFEANRLNQLLNEHGLLYSAGYGIKSKPVFFLAKLESHSQHAQYRIYIAGKEYARDLTAPAAMSQGDNIYIRRESFKRQLWERLDEWRWNKPDNATGRAFSCYDFDQQLETALECMTDNEIGNAILHEIGEILAGKSLPGWQSMMQSILFTPAELMARAVRDHYADTLHTLPSILGSNAPAKQKEASIHFYFANLTHMRKHIFPMLANAYPQWLDDRNDDRLARIVEQARPHWQTLSEQILSLANTENPARKIATLVEENHF